MAYDLLLRRQSTLDFSRGRDDPRPREVNFTRGVLAPAAAGLATAGAALLIVLASSRSGRKEVERAYYRTTRRALGTTQETPAVSMNELVYGSKDE